MLKNGTYRIQSPTGLLSEVLLFGPDGKLIGNVKKLQIDINSTSPNVQGFVEMADGKVHRLHRVKFTARGVILDGETKENPASAGSSRQMDFEELMLKN